MAHKVVVDIPDSLIYRIGDRESVPFSLIQWLYWDGMDWIQYDEVLPTQQDISRLDELFDEDGKPRKRDNFVNLDALQEAVYV